jgi:hypothetical protein
MRVLSAPGDHGVDIPGNRRIATALLARILLVNLRSRFLLNLTPFFPFNGSSEWLPLFVFLIPPPILLAVFWRGRTKAAISFRTDFPILFVFGGFPIINVIFTTIGGYTRILWLELLFLVVMELTLAWFLIASRPTVARNRLSDPAIEEVPLPTLAAN